MNGGTERKVERNRFLYGFCGSKQEEKEWTTHETRSSQGLRHSLIPLWNWNVFITALNTYSISIPLISRLPFNARIHSSAAWNHVESSWVKLNIHKTLPYSSVINAEARVTPIATPDAKKRELCKLVTDFEWIWMNQWMNHYRAANQHVQLTHTEQFRHTLFVWGLRQTSIKCMLNHKDISRERGFRTHSNQPNLTKWNAFA